jgi:hypothetical protein
LASQNAVPGETMYPVKRQLEQGIVVIASATPWTKAYFAVDRSERRFREASTLLARGGNAKSALDELIEQTSQASTTISDVQNVSERKKLWKNLSSQLEEYDRKLAQYTPPKSDLAVATPKPTPTTPAKIYATPAIGAPPTPRPTATPKPAATATPAAPTQPPPSGVTPEELARIRQQIEELKKHAEEEAKRAADAEARANQPPPLCQHQLPLGLQIR